MQVVVPPPSDIYEAITGMNTKGLVVEFEPPLLFLKSLSPDRATQPNFLGLMKPKSNNYATIIEGSEGYKSTL